MKKENIKAYNIEPGKGYAIYGCKEGISSKKVNLSIINGNCIESILNTVGLIPSKAFFLIYYYF